MWKGPDKYKTRTRRRFVDAYSTPHEEHIMEVPELETVTVDRGVSGKFLGMVGLGKRDLKIGRKPSSIWEGNRRNIVRKKEKMGRKKKHFLLSQSAALLIGAGAGNTGEQISPIVNLNLTSTVGGTTSAVDKRESFELLAERSSTSPINLPEELDQLVVSPGRRPGTGGSRPGTRDGGGIEGGWAMTKNNLLSPLGGITAANKGESPLRRRRPRTTAGGGPKKRKYMNTKMLQPDDIDNIPFFREELKTMTLAGVHHKAPKEFKRQLPGGTSRF